MKSALEYYTSPETGYNCAQSVAAAFDGDIESMRACGGGRAPNGLCGALHAAMLAVPEGKRQTLQEEFTRELGASTCRELKGVFHVPCTKCVETAGRLAEKYRN